MDYEKKGGVPNPKPPGSSSKISPLGEWLIALELGNYCIRNYGLRREAKPSSYEKNPGIGATADEHRGCEQTPYHALAMPTLPGIADLGESARGI
ncbi:hypothetical protein [Verminephrobacter aporrectodeae]|uniref:hypothetical protein n=1 Tax=Verminephrobacter aporrectodeae TaxID=1110389 RepID=UPI002236F8D0|nr:hypothetical protein [Verminephrobacter aporrectodeae]